jgi:VanZ family protein
MKTTSLTALLFNRVVWKRLFWAYFALLTTLLLWPNLKVPAVVERPDLWVHCATFGLFTLLLCLWNPLRAGKWGIAMLIAAVLGVAYGGATELLQSIPIIKRTAALDDWAADSLGVACGCAVFALVRWWAARRYATPRD